MAPCSGLSPAIDRLYTHGVLRTHAPSRDIGLRCSESAFAVDSFITPISMRLTAVILATMIEAVSLSRFAKLRARRQSPQLARLSIPIRQTACYGSSIETSWRQL